MDMDIDMEELFLAAAQNGNLKKVQKFLDSGVNVNFVDMEGWIPLNEAARNGHLTIVKCLIDNSANIDAGDYSDCTPLHNAAMEGHLPVVEYLIEKGADRSIRDKHNFLAADVAKTVEIREIILFAI